MAEIELNGCLINDQQVPNRDDAVIGLAILREVKLLEIQHDTDVERCNGNESETGRCHRESYAELGKYLGIIRLKGTEH